MKGTAFALFGVARCHRLVTGLDTHNRGVMLITEVVTLVTWLVTLITHLHMCKNGGKAPGEEAIGASWRHGG